MADEETIKESAIWMKGADNRIFTGVNHGMAWLEAEDHYGGETKVPTRNVVEGFVTSLGRFVDRAEASAIADRTKQVPIEDQLGGPKFRRLLSEDLDINAYEDASYKAKLGSRPYPLNKQAPMSEVSDADIKEMSARLEAKKAATGNNVVPFSSGTPKPPGMDRGIGGALGSRLTDFY